MAYQLGAFQKSRGTRKVCTFSVHFNKNCKSGSLINPTTLPKVVKASTWTQLLGKTIVELRSANEDPTKFARILNKHTGDYSSVHVRSRAQLNKLSKSICMALGMCENFISEKEISADCPLCDDSNLSSDSSSDDVGDESVIYTM